MLSKTRTLVEDSTSPEMKERSNQQLIQNIERYRGADRRSIDQRLEQLDREWSVERVTELDAPALIGLGVTLGLLHSRKWFALSTLAASMVMFQNMRGYYPLLPLIQRLGFRSQKDIEDERNALRFLRKDHELYVKH